MGKEVYIDSFIKKINQIYPLEFAVLFGSRARGDALKSSDYDVLLVSNKFPKDVFKRMSDSLDLWEGDASLEPVCFTQQEFDSELRARNPIIWESLKEGRVIWGKPKFDRYKKTFDNAVKAGFLDISRTIHFFKHPEAIFPS